MALIKCSVCGHMISDKAIKCPKCGNPIQRKSKAVWKILVVCLCCIVIILLGWWLYNNRMETKGGIVQDSISAEISTMSENASVEERTDSYLSISAILEIEKSGSRSVAKEKLQEFGYEKVATEDNTDNWVKNTHLAKKEVGYGGGASEIEYAAQDCSKGSFVRVVYDSNEKITWMDIEIYEKSAFEQWKKEFLELGYTITYDNTPYDEIGQNYHDTEEETRECQKEGWIIGGGRDGGCWVDMMLFNKGNKEYTDKEGTTIKPNQYVIYNHGEGSGYVIYPFGHAAYDY